MIFFREAAESLVVENSGAVFGGDIVAAR